MAFIATVEQISNTRRSAFSPGNTGSGTRPKPRRPTTISPNPTPRPPIKPRCVPNKIAYPSKVGNIDAGPRGRARWKAWYRYPCRRTSARRARWLRYTTNQPVSRGSGTWRVMPHTEIDRNTRPIHKPRVTTVSRSPHPSIPRIKYILDEDFSNLD